MIRCELCNSNDIVRCKVKKTGVVIAICNECNSVYEVDAQLMPVLGHDPYDVQYFKALEALFETWDDLEEIESYNN